MVTLLHWWGTFWFNLFGFVHFNFISIFSLHSSLSCSLFPAAGGHLTTTSHWSKYIVKWQTAQQLLVYCCLSLFGEDVLWLLGYQRADYSMTDLECQLNGVKWLRKLANFSNKFSEVGASTFPSHHHSIFWHFLCNLGQIWDKCGENK